MPTYDELLRMEPEDEVGQIGSFIIVRCRGGLRILRDVDGTWTHVRDIARGTEFTVGGTRHILLIQDDQTVILLEDTAA